MAPLSREQYRNRKLARVSIQDMLVHRGLWSKVQLVETCWPLIADKSPAALMQQLIRFKDHDPAVHSETDRRLLTNGPTAYEHIRKNR